MKNFISLLLIILSLTIMTNCSKVVKVDVKSKEASIISFELGTYKGKINGTSLLIELPYGADISSLSAKVKLSEKATIKPDPKTVRDWSTPVWFTVTAENGKDSKKYKVEVKILPPVLTFKKLTKKYTKGGHLDATEILNHVKGEKASYTLKEITNLNPNDIVKVSGSAPNLRLEFNRVGIFTALLRLKHNTISYLDVTINNANFEITKGDAPLDLNWIKQSKVYALGGEISNVELLGGVSGTKEGYRVKSVQITSDSGGSGARVSGSGSGAEIVGYSKATILTLTLVLEHNTKAEKTLSNAQFEIRKMPAPVDLIWRKQSKVYSAGGEISNGELLAGLSGTKTGYRVKTLTISDARATGARVSSSGTSAKIVGYTKVGILTLSIVFEHDTKEDKHITGGAFEITKASAPRLSWTKQTKTFSSGGEITNAHLLAGVTGSGKTGYTIKTVTISNYGGMTSARVLGSGRAAKITSYLKIGTLTLTLVLAHDTKDDVTLTGAQFEITKGGAESLTWTKQTKAYIRGGEITNADLLAGVTGIGKTGYTLKTVNITNTDGTSATVSGSGRAAKITSYNKVGTLTLTLILEHDTKKDVTLTGAKFEIYKIFDITSSGVVTLKSSIDRSSLTTVIIPNTNTIDGITVTSIGRYAFNNCISLTRITIPNSVTTIGNEPFKGCSKLTTIRVPNAKVTIWQANLEKGNDASVVGY